MKIIPLDNEINKFNRHLEHNPRVVFSARFGEGKTYFLEEFKKKQDETNRFVTLRPVNYVVSSNEDIFEYIKRDILLQLSIDESLFDKIDFDSLTDSIFSVDNMLEVLGYICSSLPHGEFILKLINKFKSIKDKYQEQKQSLDDYKSEFISRRGSIYEHDSYTKLIEVLVSEIRNQGKRTILVIEDLDRIDPHHLFRILNVLGAHIDESQDSNKFGFDNIICVLDYDVTEHIFHHFYGQDAEYHGYMTKFMSHYPYRYSINTVARDYLYKTLESECGLTLSDCSAIELRHYDQGIEKVTLGWEINRLTVRDISNALEQIDEQYRTELINIRQGVIVKSDAPIVKLLGIMLRLKIRFIDSIFIHSLYRIDGATSLNLFGPFMLTDPNIVKDWGFKHHNNECFTLRVNDREGYIHCTFKKVSYYNDPQPNIETAMRKAYHHAGQFVHDFFK